jgi:predicted nucleic-acid-binding Zn-ribbon protein
MKNGICLKCKSTNLKRLETKDAHQGPFTLKTHSNPEAFLFKGTTYYELYAIGCMKCGYVELYMEP